jgi:hypothetical protein
VVWRVRAVHPGLALPVAALTLEAAALLTVTAALAAAGSHLAPERRGGVVAAPALLALASAAFLLPARVALYAQPGSATWTPPTEAGPCCSASPWRRSPSPAATRPTAASPASSAVSGTGSPAAAKPGGSPALRDPLTLLHGGRNELTTGAASGHPHDHLCPGPALFQVGDRCGDFGERIASVDLWAYLAGRNQLRK